MYNVFNFRKKYLLHTEIKQRVTNTVPEILSQYTSRCIGGTLHGIYGRNDYFGCGIIPKPGKFA